MTYDHGKRQIATKVAWRMLNITYMWGGNNQLTGFDCSGLVQEILASVGLDPAGDQTAEMLKEHFEPNRVSSPYEGCLVFFGKNLNHGKTLATHVGYMVNKEVMIEAGGGDSRTVSKEISEMQGACVRVRPYSRRKDVIMFCDPFLLK